MVYVGLVLRYILHWIIHPLKMLPIVLFEIVYKTAGLAVAAYPLWVKDELIGSPVEGDGSSLRVGCVSNRGNAMEVFFQDAYIG